MNFKSQEKGISLLFVIIIMTVVLAIGTGLSTIFIQQGQMMTEIGYSVIAFYAADAGIETMLIREATSTVTENLDESAPGGASYTVFMKCGMNNSSTCPVGLTVDDACLKNYCMKSIGSYKTVKRAIEIEY